MTSTAARRAYSQAGAASARRRVTWPALEAFHRRLFVPLVERAACKHGLSNEDARDVVQETFLLALVKLSSAENADLWLVQAVDYLSVNFQRRAQRRARLLTRWAPSVKSLQEPGVANWMEDSN